jgi:hypothetical protein
MQIDAALVKEQGVSFAVVVVKPSALVGASRDQLIREYSAIWEGVPVVLLAQDLRGGGRFYGRDDLVRFLKTVSISALPWKRWSVH